ncbi:MAG: polysaccharide lyase family 7 protein [Pseudomonadota bacterium]
MGISAFALMSCGGGSSGGTAAAPAPIATTPSPTPTATASPSPSPTASPSPVAAPVCQISVANPTSLSPYSDPAFRTALDNARSLQFPASVNACMSTAQLQAFTIDADNFYRDASGRMIFSFRNGIVDDDASATTRMELRGMSFNAASAAKQFDASFQLPAFAERSASFTIAQVYGESEGLPIVRIAFIAERSGVSNHLYAIYRRGNGSGDATTIDLGAAPADSATAQIRIGYNVGGAIEIFYSGTGTTTRLTENLSFWTQASKTTYFKAGCYLQLAGGCEVRFTALTFDR